MNGLSFPALAMILGVAVAATLALSGSYPGAESKLPLAVDAVDRY